MGLELLRAPTMTRPADTTAYASGDLIANNTTAGSVVPLVFGGGSTPYRIQRFMMLSSNDTVTNKNYLLYLFSSSPTVTNGDNGAFAVTAVNGMNNIIGIFGSTAALNSGGGSVNAFYPLDSSAGAQNGWLPQLFPATFYGILKANAAYTPTSAETFQVWAEGSLDGPYGAG